MDQCYGLDPSRFAIKTAQTTQEKYRMIFLFIGRLILFDYLAHTQNVQFSICTNRDEFQSVLTKIESTRKKNASLTCIFGPTRYEVERQDLRQSMTNKIHFFYSRRMIFFLIR